MFINYDFQVGLSISPERNPAGYANSDITSMIDDLINPDCMYSSAPLSGAVAELDGGTWSDDQRDIVDQLRGVISGHSED